MQTKIIALAVAGLVSGAAFAQTNVTLYGRIDQGYLYAKGKAPTVDENGNDVLVSSKFSGIKDGGDVGVGGSRVGVRGEENLGNGLKAIFTWEWNLNAATGTQSSNARQAFVGLSGAFGSVTLGRQDSPTRMWAGATAPFGVAGVTATNNLLNNNVGAYDVNTGTAVSSYYTGWAVTDGGGTHSRWSNSIKWLSPVWSGVQVVAHYGFAGDVEKSAGKATTDNSRFGLGVKYANGPIYLTATYQKLFKDKGGLTRASNGVITGSSYTLVDNYNGAQGIFIGGSYDFKVVKLYAAYAYEKDKRNAYYDAVTDTTGGISKKNKYWHLGLGVPVSKVGTVQFEYAQYKHDTSLANDPTEGKLKSYSLGYVHNLSKRTTLYTFLAQTKGDGVLTSGMSVGDKLKYAGDNFKGGLEDEKVTAFAVGISHAF